MAAKKQKPRRRPAPVISDPIPADVIAAVTDGLRSRLADGEWHPEVALAVALEATIPPEQACRYAREALGLPASTELMVMVQRGARAIITTVLARLEEQGEVEHDAMARRWRGKGATAPPPPTQRLTVAAIIAGMERQYGAYRWRPMFPDLARAVEQEYGVPPGSIVRTLQLRGVRSTSRDEAERLVQLRARVHGYREALVHFDAPLEDEDIATEQATLRRLIRYCERRVAVFEGRLGLKPGEEMSPRRERTWLGHRAAALYRLLAPAIPARRRPKAGPRTYEAGSFKLDALERTAELITIAYRLDPPVTATTVKNFIVKRPA